MAKQKSRVAQSEIPTTAGLFRVWWIDAEETPVRLRVPLKNASGYHDRDLSAEEAYHLGSSLLIHAEDSGYDPDTGKTGEMSHLRGEVA